MQEEMEVSNFESLIPFCPAYRLIMPNLWGKMGRLELYKNYSSDSTVVLIMKTFMQTFPCLIHAFNTYTCYNWRILQDFRNRSQLALHSYGEDTIGQMHLDVNWRPQTYSTCQLCKEVLRVCTHCKVESWSASWPLIVQTRMNQAT